MSVSMDKSISIENQVRGDSYRRTAIEFLKSNDIKSALQNIQLAESLQSNDHDRMVATRMVRARIEYKLKNYTEALNLYRAVGMEFIKSELVDSTSPSNNNLFKLKLYVACGEPKHLIGYQLDRMIESETDERIIKRAKSIAKGKLWNWIDDQRYI